MKLTLEFLMMWLSPIWGPAEPEPDETGHEVDDFNDFVDFDEIDFLRFDWGP